MEPEKKEELEVKGGEVKTGDTPAPKTDPVEEPKKEEPAKDEPKPIIFKSQEEYNKHFAEKVGKVKDEYKGIIEQFTGKLSSFEEEKKKLAEDAAAARKEAEEYKAKIQPVIPEIAIPEIPDPETFDTKEDFEKAKTEYRQKLEVWKEAEILKADRKKEQDRIAKSQQEKFREIVAGFVEKAKTNSSDIPTDFVDKIFNPDFLKKLPPSVGEYIFDESDLGPDIALEIANKPEVLQNLQGLKGKKLYQALDALEKSIITGKEERAKAKKENEEKIIKQKTNIPEPINPNSTSGSPGVEDMKALYEAGKKTAQEYSDWNREQKRLAALRESGKKG